MPTLLVNEHYRELLTSEGLLDLDKVFLRDNAETVKALLAVRQTFRTQASDGTTLYIKRYTRPAPDSFWNTLGARRFTSPAAREYLVLQRLAEIGIAAPIPAACLEEGVGRRIERAALITIGLPASTNLEMLAQNPDVNHHRRSAIARKLGLLTRSMHDAGINHRDFYFVHLLIGDGDRIFVTDLNRADIRRYVSRRWRVKDLAALLHSSPPKVSAREKIRFARAYFGGSIRPHLHVIKSILAKARRMQAHTRKRIAQGHANYHTTS